MAKKPDLAKLAQNLTFEKKLQDGRVRRGVVPAGTLRRVKPSREGTVGLTVHVAPAVRRQLKLIAVGHDLTVHQAVCQALNLWFAQHHKPEIAK